MSRSASPSTAARRADVPATPRQRDALRPVDREHHVDRTATVASIGVDDDGPGVGDEERDTIFEPGIRGRAASGHDGAGLGLALAQRLARSAGGAIVAEPDDAGGRFTLRLPLAP